MQESKMFLENRKIRRAIHRPIRSRYLRIRHFQRLSKKLWKEEKYE